MKCEPSKEMLSSVQSRFIRRTVSEKRPARVSGATPAAIQSCRWSSLNAPPTPAPMTMRPPETMSAVAMLCASGTGGRIAGSSTAVPMRTREVRAAMADIAVTGSSRGFETRLSPTQTESSPAASARSARFSIGSAE